MTLFAAVAIVETIAFQFTWKPLRWMAFRTVPQIAHAAVHLVEGAFLLFLLRTDRPPEYQAIADDEGDVGPLMEEEGDVGPLMGEEETDEEEEWAEEWEALGN
jgi:hypothetical protein